MRKLLKYSMLIVSVVAALLLMLCRVVPSMNPYEQPGAGMLAYLTPVMVLVNIGFFVFWLLTRKFYFTLIPVLSLLLTWSVWTTYIGFNPLVKQDLQRSDSSFTFMSYNVRLLDLYKWSGKQETRADMIQFFRQKNCDVLCLQEFYTGNDSVGFDNISAIKYACNYPYVAMCDVNTNKRGRWGSVIFSKWPIIKTIDHDIDVRGSNLLQQADVVVRRDTVSLFNIHLKSNRFTSTESDLVGKRELPAWNDTNLSVTRRIYDKVLRNTISRGLEAELVSDIIQKSVHPSIVCGDLNDIASSYVYFTLKGKRKDAFLDMGNGLGATYAGAVPLLRIDYLFYSEPLSLKGFTTEHVAYSDHYPLLANFQFRQELH